MSIDEERLPILEPEDEENFGEEGGTKSDAWLKRLEEVLQRKDFVDLSAAEDLSFALMNLISIEEHLAASYSRTGDDFFLDLLPEIRSQRRDLMKTIVREGYGEGWCISKHLLATTMRLLEVANKRQSDGKLDEAKNLIERAFTLWAMFWTFTGDGTDTPELAKNEAASWHASPSREARPQTSVSPRPRPTAAPAPGASKKGQVGPVSRLVKAFIDCCRDG